MRKYYYFPIERAAWLLRFFSLLRNISLSTKAHLSRRILENSRPAVRREEFSRASLRVDLKSVCTKIESCYVYSTQFDYSMRLARPQNHHQSRGRAVRRETFTKEDTHERISEQPKSSMPCAINLQRYSVRKTAVRTVYEVHAWQLHKDSPLRYQTFKCEDI